jgi:hypothetical protein
VILGVLQFNLACYITHATSITRSLGTGRNPITETLLYVRWNSSLDGQKN